MSPLESPASPASKPKRKGRTLREEAAWLDEHYPPPEQPTMGQTAVGDALRETSSILQGLPIAGMVEERASQLPRALGQSPALRDSSLAIGAQAVAPAGHALFQSVFGPLAKLGSNIAGRLEGTAEAIDPAVSQPLRGGGAELTGMLGAMGPHAAAAAATGGTSMLLTGPLSGMTQNYWRTLDATGDPVKALTAGLGGAGIGYLEAIGLAGPLNRLDKLTGGGVVKKLLHFGLDVGGEALQEGVSAKLSAELFEAMTDEEVDSWAEAASAAKGGAEVATVFKALFGIGPQAARLLRKLRPRAEIDATLKTTATTPLKEPGMREVAAQLDAQQQIEQPGEAPAGSGVEAPPLQAQAETTAQGATPPVLEQPAEPGATGMTRGESRASDVSPEAANVMAPTETQAEPAPPQPGVSTTPESERTSGPVEEPPPAEPSEADAWTTLSSKMQKGGWKAIESDSPDALRYGGIAFPTFERGPVKFSFSRRTMVQNEGRVYEQDMPLPAGHVMLDAITVDPASRGKGEAAKALDEIIQAADEMGLTLHMEPGVIRSFKGKKLGKQDLLKWYKGRGFQQSRPGSDLLLERPPKSKSAVSLTEGEVATTPEAESKAPSDVTQEPQKTTGIKNRTVEKELEEMGLPLPEGPERKRDVELHARAKEKFDKDNRAGEKLLTELSADERPATDEEAALLTFEANRLKQEVKAAQETVLKEDSPASQARLNEAQSQYKRAADILDELGTRSGRSLRARRLMIAEDYSQAAMERSAEIAKGEPLTAEESQRVAELAAKLEAVEKAHQEYVTQTELKRAEEQAEKALEKIKREVSRPARKKKRQAEIAQAKAELDEIVRRMGERARGRAAGGFPIHPDDLADLGRAAVKAIQIGYKSFDVWASDMVARVGEHIRPYLRAAWDSAHGERRKELAKPLLAKLSEGSPIQELGREIGEIAQSFVESGIEERGALVDAVHAVVSEANPGISKEAVRDAISGYGQFRPLSQDETKKKLRDLKAQMREVARYEDVLKREPVKPTGSERRKPSGEEKRLAKQRKDLQRFLGTKPIDKDAEMKKRLETKKKRLQRQIADLEDRMERKEFGPRAPKPVAEDEAAIKLAAERESTKRMYERDKQRFERAKRTKLQRWTDNALEVLRTPRALKFSFDLPPVFRQGLFFAVPDLVFNPKRVATQFAQGVSALSKRKAEKINTKIRESEIGKLLIDAGLDLPNVEEEMASQFAKRLPVLGPALDAFARIHNTFMNLQRVSAAERILAGMPVEPTKARAKEVVQEVNILTGRGNMKGKVGTAVDTLGSLLSSPRLLLSRLQTLAGVPMLRGSKEKRIAFAKQYAKTLAAYAAIYGLVETADKLDDEDDISVSWDPRSSDFGKIRVGEKRFDILGGFSQIFTLGGREITGETKGIAGKVHKFRGPEKEPNQAGGLEIAGRFMRYKLSPVAAAVADIIEGERAEFDEETGKPVPTTAKGIAETLIPPIIVEDIYDDMKRLGVPDTLALRIISAIGIGTAEYSSRQPKKKQR